MGNNNIIRVVDSLNCTNTLENTIYEEKIKEYEHFIKSSKIDKLTGVYNEYALEEIMDNYKEEYTFIFIDINKLKSINIYYGETEGDKLLKSMGKYLINFCEKANYTYKFCRYESDEFIVCIGTVDDEKIKEVIKYLKAFSNKYITNEKAVNLRIIAIKNKYGITLKNIISYIDYLLENKSIGLDEDYNKIIQNEENLRRYYCMARRLNRGIPYLGEISEIYLVFQPQFEIRTKKIIGYEVLCRWNNKELGHINPNEFLHFIKANNRMYELDLFVFEEAFKFQKHLESINVNQKCAINVSISTLKSPMFINDICELIKKYNINIDKITVEIIEEVALEDEVRIDHTLTRLKENGINISIDDFGTGYSSLSRLYSAPFDELKIPREFITNALTDKKQIKILKIIASLAKTLNLNTVVEGVETMEQYELIRNLGFKYSQGYFHSKPLTRKEYLKFIKDNFLVIFHH